jgi:antibiotic biosynthesis monooxygenase (ABM) superfamily enzyme
VGDTASTAVAPAQDVSIVTQTRVIPGKDEAFASWQDRVSDAVAAFPGFLGQTVMPPSPPAQVDWVIMQRFRTMDDAQRWMRSSERQRLVIEIESILVGVDDIHFFLGEAGGSQPASVSAVISTRVPPDRESEYRAWQRLIASAESAFAGFQGVRLEPPVAGVQEDWVSIVRFDTNEHLQAWLTSAERKRLIEQSVGFNQQLNIRTVRGDLEVRFGLGESAATAAPPAWKENLVILLVLHPLAFLFAVWVLSPHLIGRGVPVSLALFIGAVVKVVLLGYLLVPWANRALTWWLTPRAGAPPWLTAGGAALVVALYGVGLLIFSRFP